VVLDDTEDSGGRNSVIVEVGTTRGLDVVVKDVALEVDVLELDKVVVPVVGNVSKKLIPDEVVHAPLPPPLPDVIA
jgi:hypothetical protein